MNKKNKYVIQWLTLSMYVIILMVLVGGITRLTHSGLSITQWKPVTGVLPPQSKEEWSKTFEHYKSYPEFKKINYSMTLKEYKFIYYWEYLHRMLGRFIGLLFIIPFTIFYIKDYINKIYIRNFIILFLLGLFQGLAGWYMVKSGLINNPYVSHYKLAIHLILAFMIIAYIYWTKLLLFEIKINKIINYKYFNRFLNIIFSLFVIQIIYGAFTAGLSYKNLWSTFPLIEGEFIPGNIFQMQPLLLNFFENERTIMFIHPYLGISLMILIFVFCYQIQTVKSHINFQYLVLIVFCQIILGVLTIISNTSLIIALLHQITAILLMNTLLKTKYLLKYG